MTVPRWLAASAISAGLVLGSAGAVLAVGGSPSSANGDDVPQVSSSPESTPSSSPSASVPPDDSAGPSPSLSVGDDVPAEVVAGLSEIPQSAAIGLAQAALGGDAGQLERAVLKIEDGRLVWDVRFSSGSKVEVDALAGEAVKVDIPNSAPSDSRGDDSGGSGEAADDHGGDRGSGEPGDDHGRNHGRGGDDD